MSTIYQAGSSLIFRNGLPALVPGTSIASVGIPNYFLTKEEFNNIDFEGTFVTKADQVFEGYKHLRIVSEVKDFSIRHLASSLAHDCGFSWKRESNIPEESLIFDLGSIRRHASGNNSSININVKNDNGDSTPQGLFSFFVDGRLTINGSPQSDTDVITVGYGNEMFVRRHTGPGTTELLTGNYMFQGNLTGTPESIFKNDGETKLFGKTTVGNPDQPIPGGIDTFSVFKNTQFGSQTDVTKSVVTSFFGNTNVGKIDGDQNWLKDFTVAGKAVVKKTNQYDADIANMPKGDLWVEGEIHTEGVSLSNIMTTTMSTFNSKIKKLNRRAQLFY